MCDEVIVSSLASELMGVLYYFCNCVLKGIITRINENIILINIIPI